MGEKKNKELDATIAALQKKLEEKTKELENTKRETAQEKERNENLQKENEIKSRVIKAYKDVRSVEVYVIDSSDDESNSGASLQPKRRLSDCESPESNRPQKKRQITSARIRERHPERQQSEENII